MDTKPEKIYCGNGKNIETKMGGFFKLTINPDDLKKINDWAATNQGWVNVSIFKRKEPSPKGMTHYACIDQWKPIAKESKEDRTSGDVPL